MPVESILNYLASGMTTEQIIKEWPDLEAEDIKQTLEYAAWVASEKILEFRETNART